MASASTCLLTFAAAIVISLSVAGCGGGGATPQKVKVTFVRHGLSCGNALGFFVSAEDKDKAHEIEVDTLLDPPLSDCGVKKSFYAGSQLKVAKFFPTTDFVYCSTMLRTQETALQVFPNSTIHVVPWIHEDMGTPWKENTPSDVSNQEKWIKERPELIVEDVEPKIDYSRARSEPIENQKPDYSKFFKILAKDLEKVKDAKEVHVGVVSHGMTMMQNLNPLCGDKLQLVRSQMIQNNIAVQVTFDGASLDVVGDCKIVFEGNPLPEHLCTAEIDRCPDIVKPLVAQSEPCICLTEAESSSVVV